MSPLNEEKAVGMQCCRVLVINLLMFAENNIMAASVGVLKNSILLGQVIPSTLTKAVKVQVPYFVYDDLLGAYFKKTQDFVAEDSLKVWSSDQFLSVNHHIALHCRIAKQEIWW